MDNQVNNYFPRNSSELFASWQSLNTINLNVNISASDNFDVDSNFNQNATTIRALHLIFPEGKITLGILKSSNAAFLRDNSPLLSFRSNLLLSPSGEEAQLSFHIWYLGYQIKSSQSSRMRNSMTQTKIVSKNIVSVRYHAFSPSQQLRSWTT